MIEILQTTHTGICRNCHQKIKRLVGDLSYRAWAHEESLQPTCADAPVAVPITETVKEVEHEQED